MKNLTPEMIEKAKAAKSANELLALAKENGTELTEEEANAYFEQLNSKSGELSDDDLDAVAGGGCHAGDGRLVVTTEYSCESWQCTCGNTRTEIASVGRHYFSACTGCGNKKSCQNCTYMSYEGGKWLCNHSANRK